MEKRHTFGGSIGFILAAAGSAVGLGNIWRFPYLAAKDGGGIFLLVYLILVLTFGFALLTAEVAIGRKTKQSPLTAYDKLHHGFKFLGVLSCLVPMIIMPYYAAIGGWILKYLVAFLLGQGTEAAADGYFTGFITGSGTTSGIIAPIIFMIIFLGACSFVIIRGVNKGIESMSKFIMPALVILVLIISVFALTIKYTDADNVTRTGLQGLAIYVIPSFEGMSFGDFLGVIVDAMGQLFFSLSIAMGIMIAYGSYVSDDADLVSAVNKIEIFDTAIAFLAGVMIIPAVYVFMGKEGMSSNGPGLMFVALPKVFAQMGVMGRICGVLFFAMALFAALTSGVSVMEAVVSSIMDQFGISRTKACIIETVIALVAGVIVCLGYNLLYFEVKLPTGSTAQILDIMDFVSNNVMMPVVAIATCILIGWIVGPKVLSDEIEKNGEHFYRKGIFVVMIKYVAPVLLVILFFKSIGVLDYVIGLFAK